MPAPGPRPGTPQTPELELGAGTATPPLTTHPTTEEATPS